MRLSPSRSTRDSGISAEVALSRVRRKFSTNKVRITRAFALLLMALAAPIAAAQQPNPVVRKVDNPVTDTPYVNPLQQDQPVRTPASKLPPIQAGDRLDLACGNQTSRKEPNGDLITVCEGNVDARIGTYRLQADKVTVNNGKNLVVADGNVVFDQGEQQRITGSHAEWNYQSKTGFFDNATGYTNQTSDGTRMYFTADRVERVNL